MQHCPWLVHLADKLLHNDPVTIQLLAPGGNPFLAIGLAAAAAADDSTGSNKNTGLKNGDKNGDKSGGNESPLRFVRAELYEVRHIFVHIRSNPPLRS